MPVGQLPAIKGPAGEVFEDPMIWNVNMWDASTQGLDLVADSIESGNVDQQRVRDVNGRLEHLANTGPWTEDTAMRFVKRTIGGIPVVGRIAKLLW